VQSCYGLITILFSSSRESALLGSILTLGRRLREYSILMITCVFQRYACCLRYSFSMWNTKTLHRHLHFHTQAPVETRTRFNWLSLRGFASVSDPKLCFIQAAVVKSSGSTVDSLIISILSTVKCPNGITKCSIFRGIYSEFIFFWRSYVMAINLSYSSVICIFIMCGNPITVLI